MTCEMSLTSSEPCDSNSIQLPGHIKTSVCIVLDITRAEHDHTYMCSLKMSWSNSKYFALFIQQSKLF